MQSKSSSAGSWTSTFSLVFSFLCTCSSSSHASRSSVSASCAKCVGIHSPVKLPSTILSPVVLMISATSDSSTFSGCSLPAMQKTRLATSVRHPGTLKPVNALDSQRKECCSSRISCKLPVLGSGKRKMCLRSCWATVGSKPKLESRWSKCSRSSHPSYVRSLTKAVHASIDCISFGVRRWKSTTNRSSLSTAVEFGGVWQSLRARATPIISFTLDILPCTKGCSVNCGMVTPSSPASSRISPDLNRAMIAAGILQPKTGTFSTSVVAVAPRSWSLSPAARLLNGGNEALTDSGSRPASHVCTWSLTRLVCCIDCRMTVR
mmetsp:Transcript_79403/g.237949  ORF Transcript_79403/g.237949 Transcript_79403/m.237949 type:complete len:320 (+) Transcript_79403:171-1130(+)